MFPDESWGLCPSAMVTHIDTPCRRMSRRDIERSRSIAAGAVQGSRNGAVMYPGVNPCVLSTRDQRLQYSFCLHILSLFTGLVLSRTKVLRRGAPAPDNPGSCSRRISRSSLQHEAK
jgi:hypothetical protein